jgi:hypothetical protein
MKHIKDLHKELEAVNKKLDSSSATGYQKKIEAFGNCFLIFVIAAIGIYALFHLSPEVTGMITFSESFIETEAGGFSVLESGTVKINTDLDDINSIMLSGAVYGKGKAAVFLVKQDKKHLAYYFEGDAGKGLNFSDMCYDTCHMDGLSKENTLLFELEGTRIDINQIKYTYNRIIDFDLEPRSLEIDYRQEPVKVIDLTLTNKELTDYTVLLYIDGPLSDSFSWQGSLVHMTAEEPEKIISITMILPDNLPKGTYTHQMTARYVPPDTHDFVGESPVAESFITIHNE